MEEVVCRSRHQKQDRKRDLEDQRSAVCSAEQRVETRTAYASQIGSDIRAFAEELVANKAGLAGDFVAGRVVDGVAAVEDQFAVE